MKSKRMSRLMRVLSITTALLTGACVSLEQAAPPVNTLAQSTSAGAKSGQLALGREIYITRCAKCHSVEPVRKYPRDQWEREIIPEMAEETNLNASETEAVRAYVLAVLASPPAS
jgi:mono/diheme cytochrome c family protein